MIQKRNHFCWKLRLSVAFLLGSVSVPIKYALAQPIADETLGTESSIINNVDGVTQIDGGAIRGSNLFHSFGQFNIGEQQKVFFNSPPEISNILTRVTGGSPSEILGSLGVIGDANLFLINPNGIIFGANASLDLKGSFIASTASSAIFADGIQYSATNPQATSLLTVSIPTGLQYGGTNASIQVQGEVDLEVQDGQTLGLIGGEVSIEGGNLVAPDGKIEVGGVASNSLVSLNPTAEGWSLGYENVSSFQDIVITKRSFNKFSPVLDASGDSGGDISLQGRQILLTGNSQVLSSTNGAGTGGNLVVNASELFLLNGKSSRLSTETTATGRGGDITVNTAKLVLEDGAFILTDSSALNDSGNIRFATGNAGNLTVDASISVELKNGSSLSSATEAFGNAGNIKINTASLIVNGSEIKVSSNEKMGDTGNLQILARTVSLDNEGKLIATGKTGTGGGNITLENLNSLLLRNNSLISATAIGDGNGGNVAIATDLLTALGNSRITANSEGAGNGGNIRITTQGLFLSPNSKITATSERGINGVVEINRPEGDPNDDVGSVPIEPVDLTKLIATGCGASGSVASSTNKFIITGRGGLPPQPSEVLRSDLSLTDLGTPVRQDVTARTIPATTTKQVILEPTPIVEAQGWVINSKGQVVLTASAPDVTLKVPWLNPSCHNS